MIPGESQFLSSNKRCGFLGLFQIVALMMALLTSLNESSAESFTTSILGRYPITEQPANTSLDLPIPQHSTIATTQGQPVEVFLKCGARTNKLDTDLPLTYTILTEPAHGMLNSLSSTPSRFVQAGRRALYKPIPQFTGIDSFKYTCSNNAGTSYPATVQILVLDSQAGGYSCASLPGANNVYIDPQSLCGSCADTNPGTVAQPLCSLMNYYESRVGNRQAVPAGTKIILREGIHLFRDSEKGGEVHPRVSAGNADRPVTIMSYPGEQAVINGGISNPGPYVQVKNIIFQCDDGVKRATGINYTEAYPGQVIEGNTFLGCTYGVWQRGAFKPASDGDRTVIRGNSFAQCGGNNWQDVSGGIGDCIYTRDTWEGSLYENNWFSVNPHGHWGLSARGPHSIVRNNTFDQNYKAGLEAYDYTTVIGNQFLSSCLRPGTDWKAVMKINSHSTIAYNISRSRCGINIQYWYSPWDGKVLAPEGTIIHNNLFITTGSRPVFKFWESINNLPSDHIFNPVPMEFVNNIVVGPVLYDTWSNPNVQELDQSVQSHLFHHNIFFRGPEHQYLFRWDGTGPEAPLVVQSLNNLESQFNQSFFNNRYSDPQLFDSFRPQPSSPACAGGDVAYETFIGPRSCAGAICGNGLVEEAEDCDDGNQVDGDGCSKNCQDEGGDYSDSYSCQTLDLTNLRSELIQLLRNQRKFIRQAAVTLHRKGDVGITTLHGARRLARVGRRDLRRQVKGLVLSGYRCSGGMPRDCSLNGNNNDTANQLVTQAGVYHRSFKKLLKEVRVEGEISLVRQLRSKSLRLKRKTLKALIKVPDNVVECQR